MGDCDYDCDWSMLPKDILNEIALKLDSIEDFVYFSAVCHSWNRAFAMVKHEWNHANKPTIPWLLLGEPNPNANDNDNHNDGRRKILSIERNNKCYELSLPETFGARCWGTPYGVILMQHLNENVELYNPFTKARLNLPSVLTLPIDPQDELFSGLYNDESWLRIVVRRFIVLKMPQSDEFVVMAVHRNCDSLAFARPGDQTWTAIHTSSDTFYQVIDVCFWDGVLLILYQDGTLACCDITQSQSDFTAQVYLPVDFNNNVLRNLLSGIGEMYMVVLDGHLHVVSRTKYDGVFGGRPSYYTPCFQVYKLDIKKKLWENVEDLGDVSLFVGNNTSMFVNISKEATNCQRNTIYFTDDEIECWSDESEKFRGHDMGVYDMKSRSIKKFYQGDDALSKNTSPTWFIPKFY